MYIMVYLFIFIIHDYFLQRNNDSNYNRTYIYNNSSYFKNNL